MKKKGFTLPEVMVVIAIIALIAVIAIPSVILINKNINKRLYKNKVNNIITAAELYATNNPDIFNSAAEVKVYVYKLIETDYLESEEKSTNTVCVAGGNATNGCIINPIDKTSMNSEFVLLRREAAGISGIFGGTETISADGTLVDTICDNFKLNKTNSALGFGGKYGPNATDTCECTENSGKYTGIKGTGGTKNGQAVDVCLITGNVNNNYLKYDGVMWRVMGLYNIYNNQSRLVAKMITDDNVELLN